MQTLHMQDSSYHNTYQLQKFSTAAANKQIEALYSILKSDILFMRKYLKSTSQRQYEPSPVERHYAEKIAAS